MCLRRSVRWSFLLSLPAVLFACNGDDLSGPTTSILAITSETVGFERDPDGYVVQLDGKDPGQLISASGSANFAGVSPGNHTATLSGVAPNCSVLGGASRTVDVTAGTNSELAFVIVCTSTVGSLEIATTTAGPSPDPDGYSVSVDGGNAQVIGSGGTLTISALAQGSHTVTLAGLAENCLVEGDNPRQVTIAGGQNARVSFAVHCLVASKAGYRLVALDFVPSKINNRGHIVGFRGSLQAPKQLIIWRDGVSTNLGTLESNSNVVGFNEHDVIVGWSQTEGGASTFRSFLWDGAMHDLDVWPKGIDDSGRITGYSEGAVFRTGDMSVPMDCGPQGMNNMGQVIGSFEFETTIGGMGHNMCLWDNGVFHDLGVDLDKGGAVAINDQGSAVFTVGYGFSYYAFIWRDGVVTRLPGCCGSSYPMAINAEGVVVGGNEETYSDSWPLRPVVWKDGTVVELAEELGEARDINDSGQIVGYVTTDYYDPWTGVLWTPLATSR